MTNRESDILREIKLRPDIPTYVIKNILLQKGYGKWLTTSRVLYSCKRLQERGKIIRTHTSSNAACWRAVD